MLSKLQCTGNLWVSNPLLRWGSFPRLFLLTVVAGVCTPAIQVKAAEGVPPNAAATADPDWDAPTFLDRLRILYLAMGGNYMAPGLTGTTPDVAMSLVITQYAASGAPLGLGGADLADFMDELSDTVCMLRAAPASVRNSPTAILYLKVASSLWIDLGGFPGGLGC